MPQEHCLRCGRPLEDPESQARGYGPHCWEKIQNLPVEPKLTPGQQRLKEFFARGNAPEFCCEQCGEPTPVFEFKKGLCPRCRGVPAKLEELDVVPFAEVAK